MMKDDWDVLFPAKVVTRGYPSNDLEPEYEITHLTCFIGGMYGLGGKLFGRPQDVENAKKLTDGCVWAYQSMASGIMPESARVVPCPTLDKCEFNETRWWDYLDPAKDWRDEQAQKWEAEQKEQKRAETEEIEKANTKQQSEEGETEPSGKSADTGPKADNELSGNKSSSLGKRAAVPANGQKKASNTRLEDEDAGSELPQSLRDKLGKSVGGQDAKPKTPTEGSASSSPDKPLKDDSAGATDSDADSPPNVPALPKQRGGKTSSFWDKPQSHKEYVQHILEKDRLPPGFVAIPMGQYILRYASLPPFFVHAG